MFAHSRGCQEMWTLQFSLCGRTSQNIEEVEMTFSTRYSKDERVVLWNCTQQPGVSQTIHALHHVFSQQNWNGSATLADNLHHLEPVHTVETRAVPDVEFPNQVGLGSRFRYSLGENIDKLDNKHGTIHMQQLCNLQRIHALQHIPGSSIFCDFKMQGLFQNL